MASFKDYTLAQLGALRDELQALASPCSTLREAAEVCLDRLHAEFAPSLVLGRCYTTVPYAFLPEREKGFAHRVAMERRLVDELGSDTSVVVLAATRGKKEAWNDPAGSRRRLALPLLSAECLEPISLVGRILGETVSDVPWLERQETLMMTQTTGKMSQLIVVEDARTTVTSSGSKAVRDQDFVVENGIRSVLAMGGRYLNGGSLVAVLFTTESLNQDEATKFATLVNTIKTATMKAVMRADVL